MGDALRAWDLPGLDLELLDRDDEDDLTFLIEAQHPPEFGTRSAAMKT